MVKENAPEHSGSTSPRRITRPISAQNYKAALRQGVAVEYASCAPTESARELFGEEYGAVEEEQ